MINKDLWVHPDSQFYFLAQSDDSLKTKISAKHINSNLQVTSLATEECFNLEKVVYSRNGIFALLISFSDKKIGLFNLRKKQFKFVKSFQEPFTDCVFDCFTQNLILAKESCVQIYSVKTLQEVETIELDQFLEEKLKQKEVAVKIERVFENSADKQVVLFTQNYLMELN